MNHHASERLVRLASGNAQQIIPEFFFRIGTSQRIGRRIVGATHVARMACIATSKELRGDFDDQH